MSWVDLILLAPVALFVGAFFFFVARQSWREARENREARRAYDDELFSFADPRLWDDR